MLRVLDHESLTAERVLIQLPLGCSNAAHAHSLAEHEALGNHQLLFVNRYHQDVVFFPWLAALADDLTDCLVLNDHLLAIRINFQTTRKLIDFGADFDFADVAQALARNKLLLAHDKFVVGSLPRDAYRLTLGALAVPREDCPEEAL